jgi:HSP20 family protein
MNALSMNALSMSALSMSALSKPNRGTKPRPAFTRALSEPTSPEVIPMTQLSRRSPNRTLRDLQREVDSLFDQFFGRGDNGDASAVWSPRTDLSETDDAYRLRLDVPGLRTDDIAINLQNNTLTVRGERSSERTEEEEEYVRVERAFGTFHRTFSLPDAVDPDNVEASYDEGVLTIHIPKTEESTRRTIEIE